MALCISPSLSVGPNRFRSSSFQGRSEPSGVLRELFKITEVRRLCQPNLFLFRYRRFHPVQEQFDRAAPPIDGDLAYTAHKISKQLKRRQRRGALGSLSCNYYAVAWVWNPVSPSNRLAF
jgi:hypothetical protein